MNTFVLEANFVFGGGVKWAQVVIDKTHHKIIEVDFNCSHKANQIFNSNELLFPGMGDIHVHAREDVTGKFCYKEDFYSASLASINGGLTFIADMPNNQVSPTTKSLYQEKLALISRSNAKIPIYIYGAIGPGTSPFGNELLYKVYMSHSIGGISFSNYDQLEETLHRYVGHRVSFHCEDPTILDKHKNEQNFYAQRPPEAEVVAIKKAIDLIEKYNLKGTICHVSTKEGAELIMSAKRKKLNIMFEVTPQHLYFSKELIEKKGVDATLFRMNPPIRSRMDQEYLLQIFKDELVDFLATDHAPHTVEEKNRGVSGLTGLDTYGPFCTELLARGVSPETLLKSCSKNPALHVKMDNGGVIGVGGVANFTKLRLNDMIKIDKKYLKTKCQQSVWEGTVFPGQASALIF